jgi:hypothetical protein
MKVLEGFKIDFLQDKQISKLNSNPALHVLKTPISVPTIYHLLLLINATVLTTALPEYRHSATNALTRYRISDIRHFKIE